MRITERRLRQLIRNVIKESQINEMHDDNNAYASLVGAQAHAGYSPKVTYDEQTHRRLMGEFWDAVSEKGSIYAMYPDLEKNNPEGSAADYEHEAWQNWLSDTKSKQYYEVYKDYTC